MLKGWYDWLVESLRRCPYIWRLSYFTLLQEKQHRKEDPVYWKWPTFCCGAKLSSESPDICYCAGESSVSSWMEKFPGNPQQFSWLRRYFDLIIIWNLKFFIIETADSIILELFLEKGFNSDFVFCDCLILMSTDDIFIKIIKRLNWMSVWLFSNCKKNIPDWN